MEACVSVIVPSFNRANVLPQVIPSYLQPEVGELIIVDDASTDNTEAVVAKLCESEERIKYIKLSYNSKQPHAQNVGVKAAKYSYIYFGDDDSFLTDGTIARLLEVITTKQCDIAAAKALYMHDEKELQDIPGFIEKETIQEITEKDKYFDFDTMEANKKFYYGHVCQIDMCQACFLIKADLAKKLQFEERLKWNAYREETDYLLEAKKRGAVLYGVPDAYQINLPRKIMQGGGAHVHGKLLTLCHSIYNNHVFLNKHYKYLKTNGMVKRQKWLLEFIFIYKESLGRVLNVFKRKMKMG